MSNESDVCMYAQCTGIPTKDSNSKYGIYNCFSYIHDSPLLQPLKKILKAEDLIFDLGIVIFKEFKVVFICIILCWPPVCNICTSVHYKSKWIFCSIIMQEIKNGSIKLGSENSVFFLVYNVQCSTVIRVLQCIVHYSVLQCSVYSVLQFIVTTVYSVLQCTLYYSVHNTTVYSVLQCTIY